jgi:hypothetical protein
MTFTAAQLRRDIQAKVGELGDDPRAAEMARTYGGCLRRRDGPCLTCLFTTLNRLHRWRGDHRCRCPPCNHLHEHMAHGCEDYES